MKILESSQTLLTVLKREALNIQRCVCDVVLHAALYMLAADG